MMDQLRIRGSNTLGDNSPLVVVDGVANRNMERLNPNDIESVTILKDASAAIYGSQAANGVILVTTKRGSLGKPKVTVNMNVGGTQPTVIPEMADAAQYSEMLNEIAYYKTPNRVVTRSILRPIFSNTGTVRIHGDIRIPTGSTKYLNHGLRRTS